MSCTKPPLPIPQGYRRLTRIGTKTRPCDIRQSLCFKPPYFWSPAGEEIALCPIYLEGGIYARPIDRKAQRKPARCMHCGRTTERVGSGMRYESHDRAVHLLEIAPGHLVCSRCTGEAKRTVTRHFNIVRQLGGTPTYEGQRISASEAAQRHIQQTLT
jgi:hypothetical protein